ncbi:IS3 family transposase [[Actinomadura] parvosata]|uniref:IS3 family transposase n=1 Tax=[Actinomadura] parvosata TaxID=1955412 RepID=UPI00406C925F
MIIGKVHPFPDRSTDLKHCSGLPSAREITLMDSPARQAGSGTARRRADARLLTPLAEGDMLMGGWIVARMGRPGMSDVMKEDLWRRYDNAITESSFASLECELIDRRTFHTRSEAERALFSYIEGFYNPRRRHSANGQLSPAEYERRHALKNAQDLDYAAA